MLARLSFIAFLWQQFARVSEFVIQLVIFKIVSEALGPSLGGIYSTVGSVMALAVVLTELGYELCANNFMSRWSDQPGRISFLARQLGLRRLVVASVISGCLIIGAPFIAMTQNVSEPNYYRLAGVIVFLMTMSSLLTYYLLALFKNKSAMAARTVGMLAMALFIAWLLHKGYGISGAFIGQILGQFVILIGIAFLSYKLFLPKPEPVPMKQVYSFGFVLWIQNLMNYALGKSLSTLVLSWNGIDPQIIGFFNAAFNLKLLCDTIFIVGMGATALAATARIAEKGGKNALPNAWLYNIKATTLLSVPVVLWMMFHAEAGMAVFSSKEFIPGAGICRCLLLLAVVARFFGGGASATVLQADGKERAVLLQFIAGGIGNFLLAVLLIGSFNPLFINSVKGISALLSASGISRLTSYSADLELFLTKIKPEYMAAYGVSLAAGLGSIITSYLGYRAVKKIYSVKFPYAYTLKIIATSLLAGYISAWIPTGRLLTLLLSALVFFIVFLVIIWLIKPFSQQDYDMAGKISRRLQKLVGLFTLRKES